MRIRRKKGIDSFDVPPPPPADFDDGCPDPWLDPLLSAEEYKGVGMRIRRKRDPRVDALEEWVYAQANRLIELGREVAELGSDRRALEKRVEQLEAEQHGHCASCGRMTEFPTVTWCRNVRCSGNAA